MLIDARILRWILFVTLLVTWPLPLFGLDGTLVPVARFVQLASWLSVLIALEGAGGMVGSLFVLLWGHVLVYGLVLFVVASIFVGQVLSRFPNRVRVWVASAAVVALVAWASLADPYDSMFHHSDPHASLLELYQ
jgi:hypothetical protein